MGNSETNQRTAFPITIKKFFRHKSDMSHDPAGNKCRRKNRFIGSQFYLHTNMGTAKSAVSYKQRFISSLNEILAKTSGEALYNPAFSISPQGDQIKWLTIPAVHYFANVA